MGPPSPAPQGAEVPFSPTSAPRVGMAARGAVKSHAEDGKAPRKVG